MVWSGLRWWQGRIRKNKEDESAGGGGGDESEAMKESNFDDGAPAGAGGHAASPVASGAAPVAAIAAPLAMPNQSSYETPRAITSDVAQQDVQPAVSRQNSSANANGNGEEQDE